MGEAERNMVPSTGDGALNFLRAWATANPQPAALLFGGIACFAAIAVVLSFGIRFESAIPPILYILGVGIALTVATRIVNNGLMLAVLSWFTLGVGVLWVAAFVIHKGTPQQSAFAQQLSCIVWFWNDCRTNIDADTKATAMPIPQSPSTLPPIAPAIEPARYQVFVQFAGVLTRDSVRTMMQGLKSQGWNVQGISGGGQRTAVAAGTSEVRFGGSDQAAAQALAAIVKSYGLSNDPIKVVRNNDIAGGNLEVWVSR